MIPPTLLIATMTKGNRAVAGELALVFSRQPEVMVTMLA